MLNMWESILLRKVYRSITEHGVWRIRTNQELKKLDPVADIKRKRLELLGHEMRMQKKKLL
jgi:hypothetical protein